MGEIRTDGTTDPDSDYGRLFNPLAQAGQKAAWWDPGGQLLEDPGAAAEQQRKQQLYGQAAAAGGFADTAQQGYGQLGQQGQQNISGLQRLASGQDSVSAEQLRQALQQQRAQQQSFAAGGAPSSAAARARTAAIQMGRASTAAAGQQTVAGLAERQQAQSALSNAIMQQRQQDLQAALQSRGQAIQGYGAQNAGTPEKSNVEKYGGAIAGALGLFASDRRLKTDVEDGDKSANRMLSALRAFSYRYKDGKKFGEGEHTGPMAQDLERAGSRAVIDTPAGKMVNGARLASENTAMLAALHKRLAKLEGKAA
jgi:hypothetical protein